VQALDARVRDDVGLVLDLLDAGGQRARVLPARDQRRERLGAVDRQRGVSLEELEEVLLARKQAFEHAGPLT
jgi:hypothetical protein